MSLKFSALSRALVAGVGLVALATPALAQPGSASLVNSSYLTTANTGGINPQQFTIEARIHPLGPGYGHGDDFLGAQILGKPRQGSTGANLTSWSLCWSSGNKQVLFSVAHVFATSGTFLHSNTLIDVGETAHIAGVFDGVTLRLYINGKLDSSIAAISPNVYYTPTDPVLIGAGNYGADGAFFRRFQGLIDDVSIWSTVRTPEQIAQDAGCQIPSGAIPSLLAHWVFDDLSTADVSGNARDASFTAGPALYGDDLGACDDCPCTADFNCDGTVNSTDVSDFINQWFTDQVEGTTVTDWDGNGVVNSTDVSAFINDWFDDIAAACGA